MEFYVLHVIGDVEPVLVGPYYQASDRDTKAKALRNADPEKENGIFMLDIVGDKPTVDSYSGGFLEDV